jgi:S-(hydroxymethyl)glutathione dehydrogenase/alcohol dehydrogenase
MLGTASSTRAGLGIISRDPMILGHGGVGYVEAVGPQVKRVRVGDRVVVSVSPQCGECHACLHGRADHCQTGFSEPNMPIATLADGTPVVQSTNIGGHAELMVALEEYCCAVHSSLPAEQLAMLSCVSGTGLGMTMTLSPVEPGANVVVFGAGPVGLSAVQGARIKGATRIIVIEPIRVRRELALKLGATHALDPNAAGERLVAQVRELCRGDFDTVFAGGRTTDLQRAGADIVIEAVGGDRIRPTLEQGPDPSGILPLQQSWEACAAGGHVMTCGVGQVGAVSFPAVAWSNGSKTHHSSQYGGTHPKRDLPAYVRLIEAGLFDAGALATSLYSLEQTHEAFQATGARTTVAAVLRFS